MTTLSINGSTKKFGIIGHPVSHSFSPEMHTKAFHHLGINAVYLPFPVEESNLEKILDAFTLCGVEGFNVTVPYKEKIIPFLDEVDQSAKLIGAVNTVIKVEGAWKGFNTDGSGFVRALSEHSFETHGKAITIIGAGGSAKSIAISLLKGSPHSISLLNRTEKRANQLKELLESQSKKVKIEVNPDETGETDLLINTTSVGMTDNLCPVSNQIIQKSKFVVDIIYNPPKTRLLETAENFNKPIQNGLGMLLYQGVEAFELWTGKPAPINVMDKSLKKSLAFT